MNTRVSGPAARKAFASFLVLISFIVLPFTGIMLHRGDHGGSAAGRHLFMTLHNMAAALFCVGAIMHIVNNRRQIVLYARTYRREIGLSLFVAVIVMIAAALHAVALS